ncbi:NAD(P)-dependent oxidoreductase [Microbacterium sp. Marseille-Q6965]|uniref:NAD(P)-dependent oxidoreductase n=1 Tax=Microbacterium sp. Marseille-Q6965 TaxID=2965072 RepID=UPI0021B7778C|nr:NAD(P)-dependent oxidoreductase [Microbacterium sp. Marseille-Q6965]
MRRGWGDDASDFDEVAGDVEGILLRTDRVDAAMMRRAPRLRIIARHGAGIDSVDVAAAQERGVRVTTTPGANAPAVAEHAVALLLATRRGIGAAVRGEPRERLIGRELGGSVLGLIGFGRIAQEVARIGAGGFRMTVLAHDPFADPAAIRASGVEPCGLEELLSRADAVSVHVPLTDQTRGILSRERMAGMPSHAVIINTSRGGIVDEAALLDAIDDGRIAGAGLDVTAIEPLPEDHPLRHHPRVIVTPHVGGQTVEAMRRVALEAAAALREELG